MQDFVYGSYISQYFGKFFLPSSLGVFPSPILTETLLLIKSKSVEAEVTVTSTHFPSVKEYPFQQLKHNPFTLISLHRGSVTTQAPLFLSK